MRSALQFSFSTARFVEELRSLARIAKAVSAPVLTEFRQKEDNVIYLAHPQIEKFNRMYKANALIIAGLSLSSAAATYMSYHLGGVGLASAAAVLLLSNYNLNKFKCNFVKEVKFREGVFEMQLNDGQELKSREVAVTSLVVNQPQKQAVAKLAVAGREVKLHLYDKEFANGLLMLCRLLNVQRQDLLQ